jgi:hypothetical protein
MKLTPERLAFIRALSGDEFRDFVVMDDAVEDLLSEVDGLRTVVRSLAVLLRGTCDTLILGGRPNIANLHRAAVAADEIAGGAEA